MFLSILYAILVLGIMGLLFGVVLAFASKIFEVKVDERIPQIVDLLPGANCGGCGYTGCVAFATSVVEGKAKVNGCIVGGDKTAEKIGEIVGKEAEDIIEMNAVVHCCGNNEAAVKKYKYEGIEDCNAAMRLSGGDKACKYSCLGLGTCVKACKFDAITIENGVAKIDKEKCTACGVCVASCPKHLIELIPYESKIMIGCSSKDKGPVVRKNCSVGCIACKMCERACQFDAIHVIDNLAVIDYSKCTGCGACVEKCPTKIIRNNGNEKVVEVVQTA